MADIREVTGSIYLVQSRSIAEGEGEALAVYIVESSTPSSSGFTSAVAALTPNAVFVYQDSEFMRVALYDDLLDIPAGGPEIVGGEYRSTVCTRSFSDAQRAASWGRKVYDAVTSLTTQLRDYKAVFEDVTESVNLPDAFFTDLQNRMDLYLVAKASQEVGEYALESLKEQKKLLDAVYDITWIEADDDTVGVLTVDTLKVMVPTLRRSLDSISNLMQTAVGIDITTNSSLPVSIVQIREDIVPGISQVEGLELQAVTQTNAAINELAGITESALSAPDQIKFAAAQDAVSTAKLKLDEIVSDSLLINVNTSLLSLRSTLENFRNSMLTGSDGVKLMSSVMTTSTGTAVDVETAVQKMNILAGVNAAELRILIQRNEHSIKSTEVELEELVQAKQVAWEDVIAIYPDADADHPLQVFSHRLFTVKISE